MDADDSAALETAATDDSDESDQRDTRALTECMTVLPETGQARGAPDLFVVVSASGREYLVDTREDACNCPDVMHRDPDGGCKHVRRVAFATGKRDIPPWVNRDIIDPYLGYHVDGSPKVAATDGGSDVVEAGGEARSFDGYGDDGEDSCLCESDLSDLACFEHYRKTAGND